MSSILIDFEVLPEEGPSDRSAPQVLGDLQRQLQDPNSALRNGEFSRFAASATLSTDGSGLDAGQDYSVPPPPPPAAVDGHAGQSDGYYQGYGGAAAATDTGAQGLSNPELIDRISQLERQLARTAMGGMSAAPREGGYSGYFGAPPPLTRSMSADAEALEAGRASLQQRLEAAERELREDKEASRGHRLRAEQLELKLKDREQLLVHAKEMWMKDGAFGGGGAGDLAAGFGADPYAPNSRAKVPASNGFAKAKVAPQDLGDNRGTATSAEQCSSIKQIGRLCQALGSKFGLNVGQLLNWHTGEPLVAASSQATYLVSEAAFDYPREDRPLLSGQEYRNEELQFPYAVQECPSLWLTNPEVSLIDVILVCLQVSFSYYPNFLSADEKKQLLRIVDADDGRRWTKIRLPGKDVSAVQPMLGMASDEAIRADEAPGISPTAQDMAPSLGVKAVNEVLRGLARRRNPLEEFDS
ncbi:unnamed protein product [Polarella glacialis]|uniref:Uncharacterized protein n=1 Tax=Polarella glacialis TaxID=89957 RepID=A0A813LMT2_POLGL|nr:unnamed protein product [Polarella glacialis]